MSETNQFLLVGLPWFVVHPGAREQLLGTDLFTVSLKSDGQNVGRMLVLFSDRDLAERFIADASPEHPGLTVFNPLSRPDTASLVRGAKLNGVQHVCFDPAPRGQQPRPTPYDIDVVLRTLEQR